MSFIDDEDAPELTDEQFEQLKDEMRQVREEEDARQAEKVAPNKNAKSSATSRGSAAQTAGYGPEPRNPPSRIAGEHLNLKHW